MKNTKDKNCQLYALGRKLQKSVVGLIVFACLVITDSSAHASANLLANGSFNSGITGWSTYTFGSGSYVSVEIPSALVGTSTNPPNWPTGWPAGAGTNYAANPVTPLYDGTLQLTCGASAANAGGYAWQIVAGSPGVTYTLTCQAGAQNWWLPTGEIRLWFLDSTNGIISSNFVETCLSVNNPNTNPIVALYDTGVPYQNWTNVATAPPSTVYVKVELCNPNGTGSAWFDNVVLTSPNSPPVIANLYPDGSVLLQNTNKLAFTAGSASPINASGIDVVLNGVDVTSNLVITGSGTTNVSVSYTGLQTNTVYTAAISVTDTSTLSTLKNITFDTFSASFLWEAEDYDFTNSQYFDSPVLSSTPQPGSYFGVTGVSNVDYSSSTTGLNVFRTNDTTGINPAGDTPRQNYVTAQISNPAIQDYDVGYIADGNWFNYTRDYPAGTYNIYGRLAGGQGATTVSLDDVTGGMTNNLGVFSFSGSNWGAWEYVPLEDAYGNLVQFNHNAKRTLRATLTSGGFNMNFFMLVPAQIGLPFVLNISPANGTMFATNNALSFTATSSAGLNTSGIQVSLNGILVSPSQVVSNSSTNIMVSYALQPNTIYTAVINVTNVSGVGVGRTVNFDTFSQNNFTIEAEDCDFNGGQFIDNPIETAPYYVATNSYGVVPGDNPNNAAVFDVDLTVSNGIAGETFLYRPIEANCGTEVTSDYLRSKFINTGQIPVDVEPLNTTNSDYDVGWWSPGTWLNYTRTFPTNTYHVYGRLASGTPYSGATMSLVTAGLGTPSQATSLLGSFADPNANGFQSWHWVELSDTNGSPIVASLGGVRTIKMTAPPGNAGGSLNANYYMFVPVVLVPNLSISRTGSSVSIQFATQIGNTYIVQSSSSLNPASWSTSLSTYTGDGTVKTATDSANASKMFYRVKITTP